MIGYGRQPLPEVKIDISYTSEYYERTRLHEMLKKCDYIINMLPSTEETAGLLNGSVLENCKGKCALRMRGKQF